MTMHRRMIPALCLWVCISLAMGCATTRGSGRTVEALKVIELEAGDSARRSQYPMTFERKWAGQPVLLDTADGSASRSALMVELHLRLRATGNGLARVDDYTLRVPVNESIPRFGASEDAAMPVLMALHRPGVSIEFKGVPLSGSGAGGQSMYGGLARITIRDDFIIAAQRIEPRPTVAQLVLLGLRGLTADQVAGYTRLPQLPTYEQIIELADAGVLPTYVRQLNTPGYSFDVKDLIAVKAAGVEIEMARKLREAGLIYDADQLIAVHQASVPTEYTLAMHRAGFAADDKALLSLHRADVPTYYAAAMRSRGLADDGPTLLSLHAAGVTADQADTYTRAGYNLGAKDLLRLLEAGVSPEDALQLKQAGYAFTIADLLMLRLAEVPADYALSMIRDGFTPLSAEKLIDLHARGVSPELADSLRRTDAKRSDLTALDLVE